MEPCIYHNCGEPATKCIVCTDTNHYGTGKQHVAVIWLCNTHYCENVIDSYQRVWDKVEI